MQGLLRVTQGEVTLSCFLSLSVLFLLLSPTRALCLCVFFAEHRAATCLALDPGYLQHDAYRILEILQKKNHLMSTVKSKAVNCAGNQVSISQLLSVSFFFFFLKYLLLVFYMFS